MLERIAEVALLSLVLCGCADPGPETAPPATAPEQGLLLTVSCEECTLGESIELLAENRVDEQLTTNACSWRLWGQVNGEWEAVLDPDCALVKVALLPIDPHESRPIAIQFLPENLPDLSIYEVFRFSIDVSTSDEWAPTQVFTEPVSVRVATGLSN